jgi:hypothetical protein
MQITDTPELDNREPQGRQTAAVISYRTEAPA